MPRVGLVGRTLYKTGDWNTLCLPFSLSAEQLAESPLAGYSELRTLKEEGTTFDPATGTLTLNFTPATGDATSAAALAAVTLGSLGAAVMLSKKHRKDEK